MAWFWQRDPHWERRTNLTTEFIGNVVRPLIELERIARPEIETIRQLLGSSAEEARKKENVLWSSIRDKTGQALQPYHETYGQVPSWRIRFISPANSTPLDRREFAAITAIHATFSRELNGDSPEKLLSTIERAAHAIRNVHLVTLSEALPIGSQPTTVTTATGGDYPSRNRPLRAPRNAASAESNSCPMDNERRRAPGVAVIMLAALSRPSVRRPPRGYMR